MKLFIPLIYSLVIGVLLGLSSTLAAAEIGIAEAYRDALDNDPQLQQADALRFAEREAQPQARALALPSLNARGTIDRNFQDRGPNTSSFTSDSVSIALNQPLYDRSTQVRRRQADITVDRADIDFQDSSQNLVLRVASAYFEVLAARDDVIFAQADKEAIERQLEQARRRFEVGLVTITDVQEAQARFDQSLSTEIAALNALANRREALAEITGHYYENLQPLREDIPLNPPDPADPDYWVQQALAHNPSLNSARFGAELARENIALQRSGHHPTLDLNASYSDSDSGTIPTRGGRVGLELTIPLYQGGAVTSRTREAAFRHEAAKQQREAVQRAVTRQVREAYRGVEASISLVRALDQARVSSRSSLDATQAGFDVGTRTIVEVLNSQRDLLRAERDYAQSRYSYLLNHLSLEEAIGELNEADLDHIQALLVH
jgi:outer membrane protein